MTNLGKMVKKWVYSNKYSMLEISKLLGKPMEECIKAYEQYTGNKLDSSLLIVGCTKQQRQLELEVENTGFVILYGRTGVGKSSLVKKVCDKLGKRLVASHARTNDELIHDWADLPLTPGKSVFLLEGDLFYWRTYAVIKNYMTKRKNPIVIIVDDLGKVNKNVTKGATAIRMNPPSKDEVSRFLKSRYPDWDGNISDVYDGDMRITLRNMKFGRKRASVAREEKKNARKLAYLVLRGKASPSEIKSMSEPFSWLLNMLSYNCYKFYVSSQLAHNLELLSWIDKYKYDYKITYLCNLLIEEFVTTRRNSSFGFPPFPPKKKAKKKVGTTIERKVTKRRKKPVVRQQRKINSFWSI